MICPVCGADIPDGSVFCENCSSKIVAEPKSEENTKQAKDNKKGKKTKKTDGKKFKPNGKAIKVAAAAIVIVLLIAGIIFVLLKFSTTEGEKITQSVPIGRDIDYAETKAGVDFTTASKYSALKSVDKFDYVYEADHSIKIDGIFLPEWSVMLSEGDDKTISRVAYYDFAQLQKSWKGNLQKAEIPSGTVIFGMKENAVDKAVGMKPYATIKDINNTSTSVYRYCYPEAETGNIIVCNYFVVYNDVDGTVKDVHSSVIDYCASMLKVQ